MKTIYQIEKESMEHLNDRLEYAKNQEKIIKVKETNKSPKKYGKSLNRRKW